MINAKNVIFIAIIKIMTNTNTTIASSSTNANITTISNTKCQKYIRGAQVKIKLYGGNKMNIEKIEVVGRQDRLMLMTT